MPLQTRTLGQTGLEVPCLGLGTVKFGRNQEVKYPSAFCIPEDREIVRLLDLAKSLGINLLDTAPAYGSSEQRLGRLLENRQDWVICTKVGEEFLDGKSRYDFSGACTRKSIERSLRYMRTDYLDIVLVHSDGNDLSIIEDSDCLHTLFRLKDKGLIRAVGMSTKSHEGGLKAVEFTDVVMVTYNPSHSDDAAVIDAAAAQNKGVLIKKALDSGHACTEGNGAQSGADYNLRFALDREGVSSVIVGTINPDHLRSNVAAAEKVTAGTGGI